MTAEEKKRTWEIYKGIVMTLIAIIGFFISAMIYRLDVQLISLDKRVNSLESRVSTNEATYQSIQNSLKRIEDKQQDFQYKFDKQQDDIQRFFETYELKKK